MPLHIFFEAVDVVHVVHVNDLPDGDPLKKLGNNIGDIFTFMVEMLRDPASFPNQEINELLNLTWWLVNQKVVQVGLNPKMETIHFGSNLECSRGMFAVPHDWDKQCRQRRVFCTGGLVWAASQCRDFYNGRMQKTDETVLPRARGYESEYYLTLATARKELFKPNEYQKRIMDNYPDGLESVKHLLYPRKNFMINLTPTAGVVKVS